MNDPIPERRRRAWLLAHKLITLGRIVGEREGVDLIQVTTPELCRAMGAPEGAALEQVREFCQAVAELMQGYEMHAVCGCGYLSLLVGPKEAVERALAEQRDLSWHTPDDLDDYLDDCLRVSSPGAAPLGTVCEPAAGIDEPRGAVEATQRPRPPDPEPREPRPTNDYHEQRRRRLAELPRQQLIGMLEDAAKSWLAHDGLWFLAVEGAHGMAEAIELDGQAWERFTVLEAKRIMKRHGIAPGSGLAGLRAALAHRLYAHLNVQAVIDVTERSFVFRMKQCRVQAARHRDGRPDFPCKPVGQIEYAGFARTIDERIRTECICCPPDDHPPECFCAWRFSL